MHIPTKIRSNSAKNVTHRGLLVEISVPYPPGRASQSRYWRRAVGDELLAWGTRAGRVGILFLYI
jgi:hypothetical protein